MSETKRTKAIAPDTQETPVSEWDDMREITLPRPRVGEDPFQFVGINGRTFQVPKGKPVSVPYPVYERLKIMQDQEQAEIDYRNSIPNEAAPAK